MENRESRDKIPRVPRQHSNVYFLILAESRFGRDNTPGDKNQEKGTVPPLRDKSPGDKILKLSNRDSALSSVFLAVFWFRPPFTPFASLPFRGRDKVPGSAGPLQGLGGATRLQQSGGVASGVRCPVR